MKSFTFILGVEINVLSIPTSTGDLERQMWFIKPLAKKEVANSCHVNLIIYYM